ncbi:MAG: transposase [Victivallales bacterium]|nr:transposase [Victivallales bacterium]
MYWVWVFVWRILASFFLVFPFAIHISCENNFAERHIRPIVIARKLNIGCQLERGMNTREVLMSILHTAKTHWTFKVRTPKVCLV